MAVWLQYYPACNFAQARFEHDEFSWEVKEQVKEFNELQGKGPGSFRVVVYWSRGHMALSMLSKKGRKVNAASPPVWVCDPSEPETPCP